MTGGFFLPRDTNADPIEMLGKPTPMDEVHNPTNSTLLLDSETEHRIWVLPPREGTTFPGNFRTSGTNIGFCEPMITLANQSRKLLEALNQSLDRENANPPPRSRRAETRISTLRKWIVDTTEQLRNTYATYAQLEGGFSDVIYQTHWDASVTTLSEANPGYEFRKVPLHSVSFETNVELIAEGASIFSSLPAVLSYRIGNQPLLPHIDAPGEPRQSPYEVQ